MFTPVQSSSSSSLASLVPTPIHILQNNEISLRDAKQAWAEIYGAKKELAVLGDRTHRVTAASEVALKALFEFLSQDGLQSLNISGIKFTEKFIEIFSDLLTLSKLTSLTITIDDAAFLKQFADESVIYLPNLNRLTLYVESAANRTALMSALHSLLLDANALHGLAIEGWEMNDDELRTAFFGLNLTHLSDLSLAQNKLTEKSLLYFAAEKSHVLKKLKSFILSHNQIGAIPKIFFCSSSNRASC